MLASCSSRNSRKEKGNGRVYIKKKKERERKQKNFTSHALERKSLELRELYIYMVGCTIAQRRPTQAAVLRRNFLYLKKLERASPPPGEMRENDAYQQARRGEARKETVSSRRRGEERERAGRPGPGACGSHV